MCCGCLWTRLSISARAYNCPAVQSRSKSIAGSSAVQSAKWIAPAGAGVVDNIDVLLRTAGGPAMEPVGLDMSILPWAAWASIRASTDFGREESECRFRGCRLSRHGTVQQC